MNTTIDKLNSILKLANESYSEFSNAYSDCLVATGEREVDGAIFKIELTDDLILYITSEDFSIKQFEVISKSNSVTDKSNPNNLLL